MFSLLRLHILRLRFDHTQRLLRFHNVLSDTYQDFAFHRGHVAPHGTQGAWEQAEPGHYVVGRRSTESWTKPYSRPRKYDNVVSWWNGYCTEFLSMDRLDLQRGGSYDGGSGDEIDLVKKEHINKILLPAIRGNRHRFSSHLHQQFSMYCSMPWERDGNWVLDYEQKMEQFPDEYFYLETTAYRY